MKSILIIGMGKFGHHLCANLAKLDNEIMVVDEKEEMLEDLLPIVTSAKIGDCTNEDVLRSLGVRNFDICFVCIGTNFQSSLEITSLIKELGAKYVISKANRDIHAKFLLRNGADEVIYPDRDIAEKLAVRVSANHVFDYIELTEEYSIYEIDFEKGNLKTLEGRKFAIDVFDIPTMAGWCPLEKITLMKQNDKKVLQHSSGVVVRVR